MTEKLIEGLRKRLKRELPGSSAQELMAPNLRFTGNKLPDPKLSKPSAVLILLFPDAGDLTTVFIERTAYGPHGGQISLPGGKLEKTDKNIQETALREANEEIGVPGDEVEIIGQLTSLYVPHSNFCIVPVVGYLNKKPLFMKNDDEVVTIIEAKIYDLFHNRNKGVEHMNKGNFSIEAPYYRVNGHTVWGATAMIMSELEGLLNQETV